MGKRSLTQDKGTPVKRRKQSQVAAGKSDCPNAGIINRVELRNFMNHASLSFDFQPRVNFVTGRNGTGKSALLTGLVVGLGGKASSTSRGNQLTGFIKDGKNVSDIKVTINNTGPEAYHPEVYGDSIIVERKLSRSATSDYKIKTPQGKVISTKKADLTKILDHFSIQVENPVTILNQETSKNFLCSKNPADVYKFFVKATRLEQMQIGYTTANNEFRTSMDTLKSKESALPAMELELKQANDKAAALESLDKLRTTLEDKQCQLAWAVVQKKEAEYEAMQQRVAKLRKTRPKYETQVTKSLDKIEQAKEKKKEIEERIKAMAGDTETLEPKRDDLKRQLVQKKQATRTHAESVKQVQRELARQEKDKKEIQNRINDIEASSQDDRMALIADRDEKLQRLTSKLRELETNCANAKAEMNSTLHSLTALREEKNEYASTVGDCDRLKKRSQQNKMQLEKSRNNKSIRFGRYMPALLEEVEKLHKARKFTQKPIGPLGAHIHIKDMQYALGAERALGGMMSAFYVNHKSDAILLNQAKKRVCAMNDRLPDVFTGRFTEHKYAQVHRDRADTDYPTLMDLLEVDNNCVFNCLIDQISMHNIIMVLNGKKARDLMFNHQPRNSNVCYDEKGDEIRAKPDRAFANKQERPRFLSANVEEDIRVESLKLRDICKTLSEATTKVEQVTLEIQATHGKNVKVKSTITTLERQMRRIQSDIEDLNGLVIEDTSGDVEALLSDVNNLEGEITQLKSNLESARGRYSASRAEEQEVEGQLATVSAQIRDMNSSIDPLRGEFNAADDLMDRANSESTHYKNELKKLDDKLKQEETALQRFLHEQVEKDMDIASQMSERVRAKKSPEILQAEMKKIQAQLEKEEELRGDAEEIRTVLTNLTEKYADAKRQLRQCQIYRKEMSASLRLRRKNMQDIVESTANVAKMYFVRLLHQRNYDGKLEFDHDDHRLEIKVYQQSSTKSADENKDLRGLSGGEKSFSTLCFVMSLWESISSPIRCMDEFDVFMDMVNRRISIKMLLEFAKNNPQHQFILLTPQDTSQIEANNFVHIFRMPDPKRGDDGDH